MQTVTPLALLLVAATGASAAQSRPTGAPRRRRDGEWTMPARDYAATRYLCGGHRISACSSAASCKNRMQCEPGRGAASPGLALLP